MFIYKYIYSALILFFIATSFAQTLPRGNSAWLYGKENQWIQQIDSFNQRMPMADKFNYLFPETATVSVDSSTQRLIIQYDPSVTKFYKQQLEDIKILADFSFWVAHSNFHHWSQESYIKAADQIAGIINQDVYADGVFLDLESYSPELISFYKELAIQLQQTHKILAVIVRPGEENTLWFKSLGKNAFVVLYGYDLHERNDSPLPVSPEIYQQRLEKAMQHIMRVAQETNTPVMGGLPVIATTYEWKEKIIDKNNPGKNLRNSYSQMDYLKAALKAYNGTTSSLFLGTSLWAFVSEERGEAQVYRPYKISADEWTILLERKE